MATELTPNEGKKGVTVIDGVSYQRLPIKTHLITKDDDIVEVAYQYGHPVLAEKDDVLFISEKCVACSQGRAIPLDEIHPRKLAVWLSGHVVKTPHGIGLGMVLIRSAAAAHGGTVLVRRMPDGGTSITMTLAIRKKTDSTLTSPILHMDYAGGFDHALMELADVLPARLYAPEKV